VSLRRPGSQDGAAVYPRKRPGFLAAFTLRGRGCDTHASVTGRLVLLSLLSALILFKSAASASASDADLTTWLHLLETHQHRLLGERVRAVPAAERGVEHYLLLAAMGGADLLVGRPLKELPTLQGEALPGVERTVASATDPAWRALGYHTLAAVATLRGEVWRSYWLRWRASRTEHATIDNPDTALGLGIEYYARWRTGGGVTALRAAGEAFDRCAAGGGELAGVARVMAADVAREEGDWQKVLDLAAVWDLSEIRHPLVLWAVGVAERAVGRQADGQDAIRHLNRASRAFALLRFQVRSIAWPHYERGITLLDLYPRQRNDPDRFRTLEAAQQELEAYLAARPGDGRRVADAHYHLGAIAELRDQPQAARTHYRLAAAAGHRQAQARLATLERGK
jgi:hypothetical protein